ncbi:MAG: type II secretion system protein GspL, partial [Pseudomonadota bacterium]
MASTVIFAGSSPDSPVDWRRVGRSGDMIERGSSGLDGIETRDPVILVLPGYLVAAHEAHIPANSEREARAAAPFAIEDAVASDLDDLQITLAKSATKSADALRIVYAVDNATIETWVESVLATGATVEAVYADFTLTPKTEDGLSVLMLPDRALIRDGAWGVAVDSDLGQDVLDAMVAARAGDRPADILDAEDGFDVLARLAVVSGADDLMPKRFAPSSGGGTGLGTYLSAAAAGAGVLVVLTIVNLIEGRAYSAEADGIRGEAEARFMRMYPDVTRITNLRAQMRARGADSAARPDFLILSARLAVALNANDDVIIDALRFDDASGVVTATVRFSAYEDLSALRTSLEASG